MATFPRGHWTSKTTAHNDKVKRSIDRSTVQTAHGKVTWIVTAGDEITLRGIPAIGRGVAGAIAGSKPESVANR